MLKKSIILLYFITTVALQSFADEGMWMLTLLEKLTMDTMQNMGCKLSADDIYRINNGSLKDAVMIFGGGCTAELISPKGLIITNHHCGFSDIQALSSVDTDYLTDGFWAMSQEEELYSEGLEVVFMHSLEDVTDSILSKIPDTLTYEERLDKINEISLEMEDRVCDTIHYEAMVESYYFGNKFYLVIYETYKDIRLVGAPPTSIGKFGYDTDNWMWPRHTGDFSMFRIYTDPDGKPAEYSEDNIPLKSDVYLPISLNGIRKNDFTMVLGFPGYTDRYMSSYGIEEIYKVINPNRVKIRGIRLELLKKDMQRDDKIRIQYATKYAHSSNYWKYSMGQNRGINRLKVIDKKKTQEDKFTEWIEADSIRKSIYGDILSNLKKAYHEKRPYTHAQQYLYECFILSSEILRLANLCGSTAISFSDKSFSASGKDSIISECKEMVSEHFKDFNLETDKKVTIAMLELYQNNVPSSQYPKLYKTIEKKYKNDIHKYVSSLYKKSLFASEEKLMRFLNNPSVRKITKDMAYMAARSIFNEYTKNRNQAKDTYYTIQENNALFMKGLMEMYPDKKFYPDANFTMRLSYGTVQDIYPQDAVYYNYFTTLKGVMEKEDPGNYEFKVPEKLIELYREKDYGPYDQNDTIVTCFITNNDITGGNSGSPVFNTNGELVGLAFDGNWESMSGDIIYESQLQRCICVDIRYVLFIIDKYAEAGYLLDEMTIVP